MSTENDVPLGDGARRYYEQQFGDRIRQVNKGGDSAPQGNSKGGGGSNWNGRAGCGGGAVAAFIVVRLAIALMRTTSSSSHNYSVPDPPALQQNQQLQEMLEQLRQGKVPPGPGGVADKGEEIGSLLDEDDVPLLQGLCYRIYRESQRAGKTPGKHIYQLLKPGARALLVRSAENKLLLPDEETILLEALENILHEKIFYDEASFHDTPGVALLRVLGVEGSPRFNRLLLEKCYPKQIVPLHERDNFDVDKRAGWLDAAKLDLKQAQAQREPAKR